jgi:hypothetical protein
MQTIGLVGIFQVAPKETHVQTIKRIFRIFEKYVGLWFVVSHKKTLHFDILHKCRLGRQCG